LDRIINLMQKAPDQFNIFFFYFLSTNSDFYHFNI
jgi:hypothetical protein